MTAELLLVSVALGSLGALARYGIQAWAATASKGYLGILVANIVGSGLAGALFALPDSFTTGALLAGFCGSLTTLSTMVVHLLPVPGAPPLRSRVGLGLSHVVGSVGVALMAYSSVALWLVN